MAAPADRLNLPDDLEGMRAYVIRMRALFRSWGGAHADKPEEGFKRASHYAKLIREHLGEPSAEEEIEIARLENEREEAAANAG